VKFRLRSDCREPRRRSSRVRLMHDAPTPEGCDSSRSILRRGTRGTLHLHGSIEDIYHR
jgi:hypothetical protein